MTDHVARFQGKQLRGALVLLTGEATGNTTDEHAAVAAIVELIHLATLVHDDILDGAEVRRRVACVNQRWDNQVAVLLGDFLYARAFALSTQLSSRLCSRLLAETTRTLCVGEIEQSTRRYFDCVHRNARIARSIEELHMREPGVGTARRDTLVMGIKRIERWIRDLQDRGICDPELEPWPTALALHAMNVSVAYDHLVYRDAPEETEQLVAATTRIWCIIRSSPAVSSILSALFATSGTNRAGRRPATVRRCCATSCAGPGRKRHVHSSRFLITG